LRESKSFSSKKDLITYYNNLFKSADNILVRNIRAQYLGINVFSINNNAFKDFPISDNEYAIKFLEFLENKLEKVYDEMAKDIYTRRAIFNVDDWMFDENMPSCFNTFHFVYRSNCVNLIVYLRSSDFASKFINDISISIELLRIVSAEIYMPLGELIVFQGDFHNVI